jgi:hypothetical protein|tara:strand:- start:107 stop:460 length:354 start_codon:yes stop_codon:yes gene_type:complete
MRVIIQRNTSYFAETGQANGYLVISDKEHPWFGKHYDNIDVEVHGGLTYSEPIERQEVDCFDELTDDDIGSWLIGFDTCHSGDTKERWTVENVRQHARSHMLNITIFAKDGINNYGC